MAKNNDLQGLNSSTSSVNAKGAFAIRGAALPMHLAVQMFSALQGGKMDADNLAGAMLALSEGESAPHSDVLAMSQTLTGQGRMHEAEALLRQALAKGRSEVGNEDASVLKLQVALASLMQAQGRLNDARRLFLASVDTQRRVLGGQHMDTLTTLENLAALLVEQDDLRFAEPLLCEAVALRRNVQGDTHPDTLHALGLLAALLRKQKKFSQAETLLRSTLATQRRLLGEPHHDTLATMGQLASLLAAMGNIADAEALYVRVCVLSEAALGASHHQTLLAAYNFSGFLLAQNRMADARPYLVRALKVAQRTGETDAFFAAGIQIRLGECLQALTFFEAAETQLMAGYDTLHEALGLTHPRTQQVLSDLIALYEAWGKPKKAAPFRAAHAACS